MSASVIAVHVSSVHEFSKDTCEQIVLDEGLGVRGDAHYGATVQHRSRVAVDPSQPNLRQVHLIPMEVLQTVREAGYDVQPGDLGENITTQGIDLPTLPVGARLAIGDATLTVMGLRNPCHQINGLRMGLLKQLLRTDSAGQVERLAGVMCIVSRAGTIAPGDLIDTHLPPLPRRALTTV